ncbi:MAG: hypothetical protein ACFE9L_05760, partial [Candidatus Hodarchaeota archaeon]
CTKSICTDCSIETRKGRLCLSCASRFFRCPSCQGDELLFPDENGLLTCLNEICGAFLVSRNEKEIKRLWNLVLNPKFQATPHITISFQGLSEESKFCNDLNLEKKILHPLEDELQADLDLEKEFSQLKKRYQSMQISPITECELNPSMCEGVECPVKLYLKESSHENDLACPNGLMYYNSECNLCKQCEFLEEYEDYSPYDEPFMNYDCKFLAIITEEEND